MRATRAKSFGANDQRNSPNSSAPTSAARRALCVAGARLADPARFDLRGSVTLGRDVEIDVDVVFEGSVVLGDDVRIGPYARCATARSAPVPRACALRPRWRRDARSCAIGPYARLRPGTELTPTYTSATSSR